MVDKGFIPEGEKGNMSKELMFTCRVCGKKKPISELVEDRRYFPPIYCCKKCAGYPSTRRGNARE
jgi:hypothetical protein